MNDRYEHLILGSGVAANAALAELVARRAGDIAVFTADPALPYDRPPLSKEFLRHSHCLCWNLSGSVP